MTVLLIIVPLLIALLLPGWVRRAQAKGKAEGQRLLHTMGGGDDS